MGLKILALVFNFILICWPKTNLMSKFIPEYIISRFYNDREIRES